ncbi:MAG: hypothetical protein LLG00_12040 [Planctomycetaceae bacterium]|nr:hypothetical protein [Planctomycetaceae bacterium]
MAKEPLSREKSIVLPAAITVAAVACAVLLFACWHLQEGIALPFDTYSGYFVSNKFEPNAAESFVVVANQKRFDEVFGVAMVMGDKSRRLAKDIFARSIVLTAIKRGNAVYEYKVQNVAERDGVVTIRYMVTSTPSDSASFACPMIVSIPNRNYSAVRFVENGKPAKTVEVRHSEPHQ